MLREVTDIGLGGFLEDYNEPRSMFANDESPKKE
jgi:hypothetical protein